jgi:hypothetical protein
MLRTVVQRKRPCCDRSNAAVKQRQILHKSPPLSVRFKIKQLCLQGTEFHVVYIKQNYVTNVYEVTQRRSTYYTCCCCTSCTLNSFIPTLFNILSNFQHETITDTLCTRLKNGSLKATFVMTSEYNIYDDLSLHITHKHVPIYITNQLQVTTSYHR